MANIRPLTPELALKAKELGETPERLENDLRLFKEWIIKQPHLKDNVRMDDQWLVAFIRGSKYRLSMAQQRIDRYYLNKVMFPEHLTLVDPLRKELQDLIKLGYFVMVNPVKGKELDHPDVMLYRASPLEGHKFVMDDVIRVNHMIGCVTLTDNDNSFVAGQICIMDVSGHFSDLLRLCTPANIKKLVDLGKDCFPIRMIGYHVVNISPVWDKILNLFKMFLSDKTKKRVYVHKDPSTLSNYIPKSHLPKEYGGTAGTFQEITDYWQKKLEANRDWLIEDYKYKSDESKRPTGDKTKEWIEMDGAYRKLEFD